MERELLALGVAKTLRETAPADGLGLQNALAAALERSDMIIILGGLGPNGVTLRAVAEGLDIPLEEHRDSMLRAQEYYERRAQALPENWEQTGVLPRGSAVFPNMKGPAPGCAISAGSQCILMLPGAARELYPMVAEYAYPYLAEFCGEGVACRTLRAFGLEAEAAAELLGDLLESENPVVSVYPHSGELLVRITALAQEGAQSPNAACAAMASRVRERLGWMAYGTDNDSLPLAAVRALRHHKLHAATVECGTGGALGFLLGDAPGSGAAVAEPVLVRSMQELIHLTGVTPGPDEPPESVLWRTATALAHRGSALSGTELGLSAVLEQDEDGTVLSACAALYADGQVWARIMPAVQGPEGAERTAYIAALHAFDMLRLYLEGPPDAMPDGETAEPLLEIVAYEPPRGRGKPAKAPRRAPRRREKEGTAARLGAFFWPHKGDTKGVIARKAVMLTAGVVLLGALAYLGWAYAFGVERSEPVDASASESTSSESMETESSEPEPEQSEDETSSEEESTSSEEESASSTSSSSSSSSSQSSVSSASSQSASSAASTSSSSSAASVQSSSQSSAPAQSSEESADIVISMGSGSESEAESTSSEESSESEPDNMDGFIAGKEVKTGVSSGADSTDDGGGSGGGAIAMDETVTVNGQSLTAYDAICRITMNETGGTMRKEAIKAQAVAAYSRLVARGGSLSGMGLRAANSTVKSAVKEVWGQTVQMNGRTVDVFFGASTAGKTNTAKEVWGGSMPGHTVNVDSPWDTSAPGYEYTKKMSRADVVDAIYNAFGIDLEEVSEDEWFRVDSYTGGGYNNKMTVGGNKTTTGRYLRENVLNLRSACFEWEFDSNGDLLFTTYGYGHGVGMSQQGANGMAGEGYGYAEILEYYYSGCTVG